MTKSHSSDWKFRDIRFDRDILKKIRDVCEAAIAYGEIFGTLQAEWDFCAVRTLPDFYNLDGWQIDALKEIACETELAIRVEVPELSEDALSGSQSGFGPFCECLEHAMRHLEIEGVVCVPCLSDCSQGGFLGMISATAWDWAHMRELENDPFGCMNRMVERTAIEEEMPSP